MPPKKGPSAYFLFCGEHRPRVREEVAAAAEDGKAPVTVVAKRLGELWQALPAEEKQRYQQLAADRAAEQQAAAAEAGDGADPENADEQANEQEAGKGANPHPFGFPVSLIKRLMTMDEEVGSVAAGAVRATAKATELVIEDMVAKAMKVAQASKRKTIRFSDIERVIMTEKRWEPTGMRELLADDPMFEEARAEAAGGGGRPKKAAPVDPQAQPITAFFKGPQ